MSRLCAQALIAETGALLEPYSLFVVCSTQAVCVLGARERLCFKHNYDA